MHTQPISWEATYLDGSIIRETAGWAYQDIRRDVLASFRLVSPGEIILEVFCGDDKTGSNLCYRKRTSVTPGGLGHVWYLVGWVPMGPVYGIVPASREAIVLPSFQVGHPMMYPPEPIPQAGETFTFDQSLVSVDAIVAARQIVTPTGSTFRNPRG